MRHAKPVRATRRVLLVCGAVVAAALLAAPGTAAARTSTKKAIWGPAQRNGRSQFPVYANLGAGIYETTLNWNRIAATRPASATDPADSAYVWPAELDFVV